MNCLKCGQYFPMTIRIDGKLHTLTSRRYCFDCSPWGKHNTRKIHKETPLSEKRTCKRCGKKFVSTRRWKCCSCSTTGRKEKLKQRSIDYKGGKCQSCGYNKCQRAMSFHHRDPESKDFNLSSKYCYSWKRIQPELDKCDLLCMNCHAEKHEEVDNDKRKEVWSNSVGPT